LKVGLPKLKQRRVKSAQQTNNVPKQNKKTTHKYESFLLHSKPIYHAPHHNTNKANLSNLNKNSHSYQ